MTGPHIAYVTPRELDVIRELARDGATNPQIANRLGVSLDTVKIHMRNVLLAARKPTRTALVVALFREQILLQPRRRGQA